MVIDDNEFELRTYLIIVNQIEYFGSDVHANLLVSVSPKGVRKGRTRTNQLGKVHSQSSLLVNHQTGPWQWDIQGINLSSGSINPLLPSIASWCNFLYRPKCHNVNPNRIKKPIMTGINVKPVSVGERPFWVKTIG